MNFGDILDKWEKLYAGQDVYYKDNDTHERENSPEKRRNRLLRKRTDASIDLHGLNSEEAWTALESFFENSRKNGYEKVLIIHGKGNHWGLVPNGAVLKDLSRRFIESCSFAGESGYCPAREGGAGATWVILKERSYRSR
jgi:DNA-nicking Smr family endonuclease